MGQIIKENQGGINQLDIAICYYVYKFLCKYIPWSVGKGKLRGKKNKFTSSIH